MTSLKPATAVILIFLLAFPRVTATYFQALVQPLREFSLVTAPGRAFDERFGATEVLPQAAVDRLLQVAAEGEPVHIDLEAQTVTTHYQDRFRFEIDPFRKSCLLSGTDEIALTLGSQDHIAAHEARQPEWLRPKEIA